MDQASSKALAVEVSKAIDYYPNFGRDADATKAIFKAFEEDLVGYPPEQIAGAFKEWRKNNREMPLSADILDILKWEPYKKSNMPEHRVLGPEEKREKPTKEEIAAVAEIVAKLSMRTDPLKPKEYPSPDYKHWDMLSDEQKERYKIRTPTTVYG